MQDCAIIHKKDMTTLEGQNFLNDSVIGNKHYLFMFARIAGSKF